MLADFVDLECEEEGDDEGDEGDYEGDDYLDSRTDEEKAVDLDRRQSFYAEGVQPLTGQQQNENFHRDVLAHVARLNGVRHRREDEE